MTKLSALRAASEIRAEDLADDQVNAEHIRTASARGGDARVGLSHGARPVAEALARELGMQQPAVAPRGR
jgi:hypothetical protein